MFRRIRIRAGSANFCPYNTPSVLLKHTRQTLPFQPVAGLVVVITASYADPHNNTSLRGSKSFQRTANARRVAYSRRGLRKAQGGPHRQIPRETPAGTREVPHGAVALKVATLVRDGATHRKATEGANQEGHRGLTGGAHSRRGTIKPQGERWGGIKKGAK